MIIINKGADYSACGLGKIPYFTPEIANMLSIYSKITNFQKYAFQKFIDDIGGLNGSIYQKIKTLIIPFYSNTSLEAITDVKGNNETVVNTTNIVLSTRYSLVNNMLVQNSSDIPINIFSENSLLYSVSPFGILKNEVNETINNYISSVGDGNIMLNTANDLNIQKFDGTYNQNTYISKVTTKSKTSYVASGSTGIDSANQNVLIRDGVISLCAIQPNFNITKISQLGTLGYSSMSASMHLYNAYMLGWAEGLTREEAIMVDKALGNFIDYFE